MKDKNARSLAIQRTVLTVLALVLAIEGVVTILNQRKRAKV